VGTPALLDSSQADKRMGIQMTGGPDHQQIRRDATTWLDLADANPYVSGHDLAEHCLALLTDIEECERRGYRFYEKSQQAEATLSDANEEIDFLKRERNYAEARLAKVPPLVEAAKTLDEWSPTLTSGQFRTAQQQLRAALAAWEQKPEGRT
jgi:hypothetical protein